MSKIHPLLKAFMKPGEINVENAKFPKVFVEQMLETNERFARESERTKVHEALVCRLLANGMSEEEISVVLKVRADEISLIEHTNKSKIDDYANKLKARRNSRAKRGVK